MTERGEASRIDARLHKNSGRGMVKGDATWHQFCVDIKEFSKSFSLSRAVWSKVCTDALKHKKDPMLLVVLDGQTRLAVIELDVLEELIAKGYDNSAPMSRSW